MKPFLSLLVPHRQNENPWGPKQWTVVMPNWDEPYLHVNVRDINVKHSV